MVASRDDPVLILTGAPGSGKTTVAQFLAAKWPRAVHIESDQFFHFIKSGYVEPWKRETHAQNSAVMRIVAHAAASYAGPLMPRRTYSRNDSAWLSCYRSALLANGWVERTPR